MSDESKPSKDIDPHIIDQPMLNNPKLALLFTDYQEVMNLFPGESLLSFARKFVDATHDPVTSEKNFYLGLNDTGIKLETIDNPNIDYDKLKEEANIDDTEYTQPPEDATSEYKLEDILDVDVQIILYWVEKFRCIHETVKQEIWSEIPKEDSGGAYDNTNTYFNNFNESFFSIRDDKYIKDRSSISYLIPVSPREQYNKNMLNLCFDYDRDARYTWIDEVAIPAVRASWPDTSKTTGEDPSLPHGNNNVTDSIHLTRIEANVDAVQLKMNEILGDMKRVFDFLDKNTSEDTQEWGKWNHSILKDRVWMQVDQSLTELSEILEEDGVVTPLTDRKNQRLS